ncbi:MAG: sigma 54-interacting transcriptional regulator [Pyrinomonadaceae bacterium]
MRIPLDRYEDELGGYLGRKYGGVKFDLIITIGAPALQFLSVRDSEVFRGTPIIFYFHDESEETARRLWPGVTGVWGEIDVSKTLDMALALQPELRRVVVVSGRSDHDRFIKEQAQSRLREYEGRVEITYLDNLTIEELKNELAALPKESIVLLLSFSVDRLGNTFTAPEVASRVAPTSGAPVYGISDTQVGAGIVGGSVLDFTALGKRTGEMGLRILSGERPQDILPQTVPGLKVFDWRELQRRGLSPRALPPGSVVRFKEPTFWELYRWYVVGVVVVFAIEALLIAGLLVAQRRRRRAERERERLAGQVEADHRRLNELVSNVPGIVWETLLDPRTEMMKTVFISNYVEKMLGYTPATWLSSPPGLGYRLMTRADQEMAAQVSAEVMKSGREAVIQHRWGAKDGRTVWAESHLSPMVDEAGEVVGLRGVSIDITEKKLAEDTRRQSEERYRTLFDSIDEGFCVIELICDDEGRAVDGLFSVTNPGFERQTGWKGAQGRRIGELIPDLEQFWFERYGRVAATGEPERFTGRVAGLSRWFDVYAFRVGEAGSRTVAVIFSDVSERIRAEEQIKRSAAVLAQAGRLANLGAWEVDLTRSAEINENPLAWSDQVYRIYGYEPGAVEVTSGLFFRHVHPDDRRRIDQEIRAAVAGRRPYDQEHRIVRADGAERVVQEYAVVEVDESGQPLRIIGAVQDVTERKEAEEALRQSEGQFRNMADTAPVLIWVAGPDKLRTYVNKQWLDFTGRSLVEELGDGWTEGVHPEDHARCIEVYTSSFDHREPFVMEYRLRRADGSYRWMLSTGTPRFSSGGEFLGFIGSSVDIHDRKESEESLRLMMEELHRLKNQLQEENVYLREEIKLEQNFSEIVGRSDAIKYILHKIEQVAPTDSTVLITGETGTGKELVARAIHGESHRRARPLVKVNCSALSPGLIESELFGHERGAFTGATGRKAGRFELADGATIFLDEIGELPLGLQAKLLRVIQEGEFERLGGNRTIRVDVRIVAATNRNLWKEVQAGAFREDLFYRLNVFPITVPPLRQRAEDIPHLVEHFVGSFSRKMGKKITSVTPATLNALCTYAWPGNVRELANVIERAVINNNGGPVLQISNLAETLSVVKSSAPSKTLEEMEREYIVAVLDGTSWRIEGQHGAARILGLHPSTLRTRMAKLRVEKPHPPPM